MLATISVVPLLIMTVYLTAVSVLYCLHERRATGEVKIYDKLVLTTAAAVFMQVAVLLGGVIAVNDLENWQFNIAFVFVECVFGSASRCIVQLSLWLQMRCIFRGRDSSQKNISYMIGNLAALTSIVSSVLSLAGHSAGEALKRKVLGWELPCKTFVIIKLILTLTNVTDLTTKMTLISLVLYEVLRQKQANCKNGFSFEDLQNIAKRMVICMMFALINDLVLLTVALLPQVADRNLRADLMPTVSCMNSLCNLIILIISFPTWKERLIPRKLVKATTRRRSSFSNTNVRTVATVEESRFQTEMTSDFPA